MQRPTWSMARLAWESHTSVFSGKAPNFRPLDTGTARHFPSPAATPGKPEGSTNIGVVVVASAQQPPLLRVGLRSRGCVVSASGRVCKV